MVLQGMREVLALWMRLPVMHSASARFAYVSLASKAVAMGFDTPRGILSLWKGSASTATRMGGESTQNLPHT